MAQKILVVDDEQDLCEILQFNLESEGLEVCTACSGEEALEILSATGEPFSLMILDVMMERMSGFDVAERLREEGNNIPIIFVTALTQEADQLRGFQKGGDDYICKPYSFPNVLARVKAILKRTSDLPEKRTLDEGILHIDLSNNTISVNGNPVVLTKKELTILLLLVQNKGKYFSREEILQQAWNKDTFVGDRSVDVHIARIRKKLGEAGTMINNKTGFGYHFEA